MMKKNYSFYKKTSEVYFSAGSMIGMEKLYIDDSQNLKEKVQESYKHLFMYDKKKL